MNEFPKAYDQSNEPEAYKQWETSGYFTPDALPGERAEPFSIAMPPSNTTGVLHIGHAMGMTLQDIMTRYERMRGKRTLWLPGTDHAAIATQNVVEKELKKEKTRKEDLGREKFLERVDAYVEKSRGRINEQVARLGASCDWSRERFTLDAGLTHAVHEAFVTLYNDGLIYRGTRVVNWCPRDQSTLADDEIEYTEQATTLYTFKYDKVFPLAISTTRPETKFGDTAVAVHPSDERYTAYVGKEYAIRFAGVQRTIRVVADHGVDKDYGTGALGVTPAHSAIDERIAQREHLPPVVVIGTDGRMTAEAGDYAGLNVKEARDRLVEALRKDGLIIDEQPLQHNLSVCYRCGTPIEPMPLLQWFVAVDKPTQRLGGKTLKERALQVITNNEIRFVPERFGAVYQQWMENLHDWCISRQIWYGHRIPVWYKGDEVCVGDAPNDRGWTQDPDTLDTWFSSALWTFSTLGWPEQTEDLKTFHPTSVMETSYDIIFFWVARMILMSTYLLNDIPFKSVYLHGLVRDAKGRKMSKSLNNGIDPLEMAAKYGADALRLSLVVGTTPGKDQRLDEQKIKGYRNYVNKIWNIGRFVAMQGEVGKAHAEIRTLADRWVVSSTHRLLQDVTMHLGQSEFSTAGEKVYDFAWHEFADWYLEVTKVEGNIALARDVFRTLLILLHPFMPFVTEALWKELGYAGGLLMIQPWPEHDEKRIDYKAEEEFSKLQERVTAFRKQRVEQKIPSGTPLEIQLTTNDPLRQHQAIVERLGKVRLIFA